MARTRQELHDIFKEILGSPESYVYFSPPNGVQMRYPCITYELEDILHSHAGNKVYRYDTRYSFTLIVQRLEEAEEFIRKIEELPYCAMDRPMYVVDHLFHFSYTIFW